ncbi:MAG: formylglycine-generating enzyme family protein [Pirellulales bacterium]|nr:formylglycine-generating enzyme family protein [Pirellulales bacterium]
MNWIGSQEYALLFLLTAFKPRWFHLAFAALVGLAVWGIVTILDENQPSGPAMSIAPTQGLVRPQNPSADDWNMVLLPAGRFAMGSRDEDIPDAHPVHEVSLDAFKLDTHAVTNWQFTAFIAATHHVTTAEQVGHAWVFDRQIHAWRDVPGADWLHPNGPDSSIAGRDQFPVVQVSWFDATAYAKWAGKRLATEAEYEYAARSGRADSIYPWGIDERPDSQRMANYWQGRFPFVDLGRDGFRGLAPVGKFSPNPFGLLDMAGNAWCWCHDWYAAEYYFISPQDNPRGPDRGTDRVLRGGSWLSARNFRFEIRTAVRWHAPPEYASNHVGFRCAAD